MAEQLWEPLVNGIVSKLTTNLNGYIDTINSQQTSPAFAIEYPQRILDYIPPISDLYALPTIGISDGDFHIEDDVGWGGTGVCEFSIVVFLADSDQRALAWKLRRYAQAVYRCVMAEREIPTEGWGVTLKRVRSGPTLGRDEGPRDWLSTIAVQIEVKSEQDQ